MNAFVSPAAARPSNLLQVAKIGRQNASCCVQGRLQHILHCATRLITLNLQPLSSTRLSLLSLHIGASAQSTDRMYTAERRSHVRHENSHLAFCQSQACVLRRSVLGICRSQPC